jgi:hypothetical protein
MTLNDMDRPPTVSGLKSVLTLFGLLVGVTSIVFLSIAWGDRPYVAQAISAYALTLGTFFLVFCDSNGLQGYDLKDERVRRELPGILGIHFFVLVFLFVALSYLLSLRPHLPAWWAATTRLRNSDAPRFDVALIFAGCAVMFVETYYLRRWLARALDVETS